MPLPTQPAFVLPTGRTWPPLAYPAWHDTGATLQLWTQVVGTVRLALSPWLDHGWQVPLYINARGLGTSAMHTGGGLLEIDFDFVEHHLVLRGSEALPRGFELAPMSVAAFYRRLMGELAGLGVTVEISTLPNEVTAPIPPRRRNACVQRRRGRALGSRLRCHAAGLSAKHLRCGRGAGRLGPWPGMRAGRAGPATAWASWVCTATRSDKCSR